MRVKTYVNEVDVDKLAEGQRTLIQLDALPGPVFAGVITHIATLGHEKEGGRNIKIFDVEIALDKEDVRLKPGMPATSEVIVETVPPRSRRSLSPTRFNHLLSKRSSPATLCTFRWMPSSRRRARPSFTLSATAAASSAKSCWVSTTTITSSSRRAWDLEIEWLCAILPWLSKTLGHAGESRSGRHTRHRTMTTSAHRR